MQERRQAFKPRLQRGLAQSPAPTPATAATAWRNSPANAVRLIKRVVAIGGDRVSLREGRLFVNGAPLQAHEDDASELFGSRRARLNLEHGGGRDIRDLVVPPGEVLLLGDRRGASRDGRAFGTVPATELYGRAIAVFWSRAEGPGWKPL